MSLAVSFAPNQSVRIHGLKSRADLNEQTCTVIELDPRTSRWVVRLDNGTNIKLKADNLVALDGDGSAATQDGMAEDELSAQRAKLDEMLAEHAPPEPRHVVDGLFSGISVAAAGVGAGVIGLVAAPIAGAQEDGVAGFVKGLGVGVASAVALPVLGAVAGVSQGV